MKKVMLCLLIMLSFKLSVDASEKWELTKINLSEKYKLDFIVEKKDDYLIAVGDEYDCSKGKCDLYKIELDGTITKLNDLLTYESSDLAETTFEIESGSLIKKKCINDNCSKISCENSDVDREYIYVDCAVTTYYEDGIGHVCELGFKENDTIKYGIVNTKEEYIVEPSSDYSTIEKDENFEQNMAILKKKDGNYIAVSENEKPEAVLNDIIKTKNVSYIKVDASTENTNYYTYNIDDVPLKDGEVRPAVINYDKYFTKDKDIEIVDGDTSKININLILIDEKPYFLTEGEVALDGDFDRQSLYDINSKNIFRNSSRYGVFDNKYIYYESNNKLYISDGDKIVFEQEWDDILNFLGFEHFDENTNTYYFVNDYKSSLPEDTQKYRIYTLKISTDTTPESPTEDPVVDPSKPSETPKYSCKEVDGKYYGKDGSIVDKKTYESVCGLPENPHTGQAISIVSILMLFGLGYFIRNKKAANTKISKL